MKEMDKDIHSKIIQLITFGQQVFPQAVPETAF